MTLYQAVVYQPAATNPLSSKRAYIQRTALQSSLQVNMRAPGQVYKPSCCTTAPLWVASRPLGALQVHSLNDSLDSLLWPPVIVTILDIAVSVVLFQPQAHYMPTRKQRVPKGLWSHPPYCVIHCK